jgi:hypothetical protein
MSASTATAEAGASEAKRLRPAADGSATASISEFQAVQWGHLPCHFGVLPPHSVQL